MSAKDRPFTKLAAKICGLSENLKAGRCPICGCDNPRATIRDEISLREFRISQLCQQCQDENFHPHQ